MTLRGTTSDSSFKEGGVFFFFFFLPEWGHFPGYIFFTFSLYVFLVEGGGQ